MHRPSFRIGRVQHGQESVGVPVVGIEPCGMVLPPEDDGHPVVDPVHQFVGVRDDDGAGLDGLSGVGRRNRLSSVESQQRADPPTPEDADPEHGRPGRAGMAIDFRGEAQAGRGELVLIAHWVTQGLRTDWRETKTGLTACQGY